MKPNDILTLLQIVELSSKSPAYAGITSTAHQALLDAQLILVPPGAPEHPTSPPPQSPSHPTAPPGPTPSSARRG